MLPFLLFLCALTGVASSEVTSPSPSPPSSSTMTLETWELALIIGSGTLALLMCAYSVFILMRNRRVPKPLTKVVVEMQEGRDKKDSKTTEKKETPKKETPKKETPKKETPKKETPKKETPKKETPKKETPKTEMPTVDEEVIAVKIQPNNYAVMCPGGGKACIGPRKDGVKTIPQPTNQADSRPRRGSAPSRFAGGRSSAPRAPRV